LLTRDLSEEDLETSKTENVPVNLKNPKVGNRGVYWIRIQLKQNKNSLYDSLYL